MAADNFYKYSNVKSELRYGRINENVFLTIFIPTYNRLDTLKETLQSALNQESFSDYEILILDNASDNARETLQIVKNFDDEKILYYVNETNLGLCGNWNRGTELAHGKFITMIHDDDVLSPYFVNTVAALLRSNRNYYGILGFDYIKFSSSVPDFEPIRTPKLREITIKDFFYGLSINIAGMTFNKRLIEDLGGFYDEEYPNEDTYLICRAVERARVINICNNLVGYRVACNTTLSGNTLNEIIFLTYKMRRDIASRYKFARKILKHYDSEYIYLYIKNAKRYWSREIDYKSIFNELGPIRDYSKFKLFLLKLKLKRYYFITKIKNFIKMVKL